jgi:hypothetical protein
MGIMVDITPLNTPKPLAALFTPLIPPPPNTFFRTAEVAATVTATVTINIFEVF